MKHTTSSLYSINHLASTITVSKRFLKEAGVIGSDSYHELLQLRRELPDYKFEERDTKKPHRTKIGSNLNYKKMKNHIEAKEGADSPMLQELEKVMKLATSQRNPFQYTKTWFLLHYKEDFIADETTESKNDKIIIITNN